jgi:hypothetical protein
MTFKLQLLSINHLIPYTLNNYVEEMVNISGNMSHLMIVILSTYSRN